jgi:hypothetical protein
MSSIWRMFVVVSLALVFAQGAFAHAAQPVNPGAVTYVGTTGAAHAVHDISRAPSHCSEAGVANRPCHHDHSICCTSACGVHCGALFAAFHFETRASGDAQPLPFSEPPRESVAHAPLLRPPIA